jgi:hypothetical protein
MPRDLLASPVAVGRGGLYLDACDAGCAAYLEGATPERYQQVAWQCQSALSTYGTLSYRKEIARSPALMEMVASMDLTASITKNRAADCPMLDALLSRL